MRRTAGQARSAVQPAGLRVFYLLGDRITGNDLLYLAAIDVEFTGYRSLTSANAVHGSYRLLPAFAMVR
jgi:hypothetical protein